MIRCVRCGKSCQTTKSQNPEARPFRYAHKGLCANCAVTQFLLSEKMEPIRTRLLRNGIEVLRNPAIQAQFARILATGGSELSAERIDWDVVIKNWDLPSG